MLIIYLIGAPSSAHVIWYSTNVLLFDRKSVALFITGIWLATRIKRNYRLEVHLEREREGERERERAGQGIITHEWLLTHTHSIISGENCIRLIWMTHLAVAFLIPEASEVSAALVRPSISVSYVLLLANKYLQFNHDEDIGVSQTQGFWRTRSQDERGDQHTFDRRLLC